MAPGRRVPPDTSPRAAASAGLLLLSRRELSASQLRTRLLRKGYPESSILPALDDLRRSGALDDARAAGARARHDVHIHRRGRARVLRQIRAMGIEGDIARDAVAAAFEDVSESRLMADALRRRLKGQPPPTGPRDIRRLQAWLLRQGFPSDAVRQLLRRRFDVDDE